MLLPSADRRLVLALAVCLHLAGCGPDAPPTEPLPPSPAPSADPLAPVVGEAVEQAARFWLARPDHDPGGDGWRRLGTPGAELLRATWEDREEGTFLRQRAVACLGEFREPWVRGYLEQLVAKMDAPPPVRADAARSLVTNCRLTGEPEAPLGLLASLVADREQPVGLRRDLPGILAQVPGETAAATLRMLDDRLSAELATGAGGTGEGEGEGEGEQRRAAEVHAVARAVDLALREHTDAAARLQLASRLGLGFSCTDAPEFLPAPPEERLVGVTGPDHLGTWRNASVCVSALSQLPDDLQLRIDFDPLDRGLEFTGRALERTETVVARPGERVTACRAIEITGAAIQSEVWVYAEGFAAPIHRELIRIQPEPAR